MARCQRVRGVSSYQKGRQLPDNQIVHLSTYSLVSGCNIGLESPLRMVLRKWDLNSWKVRCDAKKRQLKVVHLMCTRCVTVRRVCIKESSRLETGGETYSNVKYLSSENAVGMPSRKWIVQREGGVAPSNLINSNWARTSYMGQRWDCKVYGNSVIKMI